MLAGRIEDSDVALVSAEEEIDVEEVPCVLRIRCVTRAKLRAQLEGQNRPAEPIARNVIHCDRLIPKPIELAPIPRHRCEIYPR